MIALVLNIFISIPFIILQAPNKILKLSYKYILSVLLCN